jgi:hypothetical protein
LSKDASLAVNIAAVQNKRRVRMYIGGVLLLLSLLAASVLLLITLNSSTDSREDFLSNSPSEPLQQRPLKKRESDPQIVDTTNGSSRALNNSQLAGLTALDDDVEFGELAAEIVTLVSASMEVPSKKIEELDATLQRKVQQINSTLRDALTTHNEALIRKVTDSPFFKNYAVDYIPAWSWTLSPKMNSYSEAAIAAIDARSADDGGAELRALYEIRSVTGFDAHQKEIEFLESQAAKARKSNVKTQFLELMTVGQYEQVIFKSRDEAQLVAEDPLLQDLVRQARMALSKIVRDDLYETASRNAADDEWDAVRATLGNVPEQLRDSQIEDLERTANAIGRSQADLEKLISRPQRLSDPNVENYAKRQLEIASKYASKSARLSGSINELQNLLKVAALEVRVKIKSDNLATILIPGLGYVEPTLEKTLSLRQAEYKFIVRCAGMEDEFHYLDLRDAPLDGRVKLRLTCGS